MRPTLRTLGLFVGVVFAAGLALYGYRQYGRWRDAQVVKWRADSGRVADTTRVALERARIADTVYLTTKGGYVQYRTRVLTSPTATARDTAAFGKCDAVIVSCDQRHAADSVVIAAKDRELAVARAKPTERPRRFELWGEALYDVSHMAPVFRAGAELRLLGPIKAVGAGDLSIPSAGQSRVDARVLVGIRYTFE